MITDTKEIDENQNVDVNSENNLKEKNEKLNVKSNSITNKKENQEETENFELKETQEVTEKGTQNVDNNGKESEINRKADHDVERKINEEKKQVVNDKEKGKAHEANFPISEKKSLYNEEKSEYSTKTIVNYGEEVTDKEKTIQNNEQEIHCNEQKSFCDGENGNCKETGAQKDKGKDTNYKQCYNKGQRENHKEEQENNKIARSTDNEDERKAGDKSKSINNKQQEKENNQKRNVKNETVSNGDGKEDTICTKNPYNKENNHKEDIKIHSEDEVHTTMPSEDENELENSIELIKLPENNEYEEMIVPDSGNENDNQKQDPEIYNTKNVEDEIILSGDESSEEPELTILSTNLTRCDPLNDDSAKKVDSMKIFQNNCEDDDDEVQIIEIRNSPICIDSDDDDNYKNADKLTPKTTVTLMSPSQPSVRRVFARKSTAKATTSMSSKFGLNCSTLRSRPVIDTIELLDSTDDDDDRVKIREKQKKVKRKTKKHEKGKSPLKKRRLLSHSNLNAIKKNNDESNTLTNFTQRENNRNMMETPAELFPSTPQTKFLNAINLQPTSVLSMNPPVFSAQLLDKNVLIPNAFYGNPQSQRERTLLKPKQNNIADNVNVDKNILIRSYQRWLENFITQFSNPTQIATHSCFVLLQRVLKYKIFMGIKDKRINLNTKSVLPASQFDFQLMLDLRNAFYTHDKNLTDVGRLFCELASTEVLGTAVPLTTDITTGRITSRTRTKEELQLEVLSHSKVAIAISSNTTSTSSLGRKKYHENDIEYKPDMPLVNSSSVSAIGDNNERRKSLRNRARRLDENFTYNEEDVDDEFQKFIHDDYDEKFYAAVEQKRLEAKKKREIQVKSFENAFVEMFCKEQPTSKDKKKRKTVINNPLLFNKNDAIIDPKETVVISDDSDNDVNNKNDEEPRVHLIYKVPSNIINNKGTNNRKETQSVENDLNKNGSYEDNIVSSNYVCVDPSKAPKNIDRSMHTLCKDNEWCVLCMRRVSRTVHHYVNEHRGCEVYNSRLSDKKITLLYRNEINLSSMCAYKNGQQQFEAHCIFCEKNSRFMLPYWYLHFTMHTGEYVYRCNGCGIRKPTRSLLTQHINQPCPMNGQLCQDYKFTRLSKIEAHVCALCNYTQMHRWNIEIHLRNQHNIKTVQKKQIQKVILLKTTKQQPTPSSYAPTINTFNEIDEKIDSVGNDLNAVPNDSVDTETISTSVISDTLNKNSYNEPDDDDDDDNDNNDDLSYMICEMLDVEMHTD